MCPVLIQVLFGDGRSFFMKMTGVFIADAVNYYLNI